MSSPVMPPPAMPHCLEVSLTTDGLRRCALPFGHPATEPHVFSVVPLLSGPAFPADPLLPLDHDASDILGQLQAYMPLLQGIFEQSSERSAAAMIAGSLAMGFGNVAHGTEDQIAKRAWDIAEALTREAKRRGKGEVKLK